ncbi:hypothetical protein ACTXNJ_00825, partial [Pseudomonas helleri]|uniref:hypothetical protein n=1 Tax=Pseudomonas helleri TaxID=1608996 RepID=UPI003FCFDAD7
KAKISRLLKAILPVTRECILYSFGCEGLSLVVWLVGSAMATSLIISGACPEDLGLQFRWNLINLLEE